MRSENINRDRETQSCQNGAQCVDKLRVSRAPWCGPKVLLAYTTGSTEWAHMVLSHPASVTTVHKAVENSHYRPRDCSVSCKCLRFWSLIKTVTRGL